MGYVNIRRQENHGRRIERSAGSRREARDITRFLIALGLIVSLISLLIVPLVGIVIASSLCVIAIPFLLQELQRFRHRRLENVRSNPGGEKQLLMAIRDSGGLTAVEAALETSLTVDEADELLSRLANRGHLFVGSRDGACQETRRARSSIYCWSGRSALR